MSARLEPSALPSTTMSYVEVSPVQLEQYKSLQLAPPSVDISIEPDHALLEGLRTTTLSTVPKHSSKTVLPLLYALSLLTSSPFTMTSIVPSSFVSVPVTISKQVPGEGREGVREGENTEGGKESRASAVSEEGFAGVCGKWEVGAEKGGSKWYRGELCNLESELASRAMAGLLAGLLDLKKANSWALV